MRECCGHCDYYVAKEDGKGQCSAPVPSYVAHSNLSNEVSYHMHWDLECMFFIDSCDCDREENLSDWDET